MKHIFTSLLLLFLSTSVFSQLIINEVLYDPSNSGLDGDANGDGVYGQDDDSFIEFFNNSSSDLDVSGYQIWDDTTTGSLLYTIAPNTIMPAMSALVVFGGGVPVGTFGGALVQVADTSASGLNFNNSGEVIVIKNAMGVTMLTFDSDALSNNPNESYTRFPDITGDFIQHGDTTSVLFSPGTKTDGSIFEATIVVTSISVQGAGGATTITEPGGMLQMEATVLPNNASNTDVTWSVTNGTGEATISTNGELEAAVDGTVTVVATANDGSGISGSTEITLSNQPNAVAELSNALDLNIYPNPSNGLVNIDASENIDLIEVFDIIGKTQLTISNLRNNTLDLSALANGQYILRVTGASKTQTALIFKN
jgi:hypothetical protein